MESQKVLTKKQVQQKIQLVKGEFTCSEAAHVITRLIDEKINFHKLQRLQMIEGDHVCNTNPLSGRIQELEQEKETVRKYFNSQRPSQKTFSINGVLEITVSE